MPLPVNLFRGEKEMIDYIFSRLDPLRPVLQDDLPKDPLGLCYWLLGPTTLTFLLGDTTKPIGIFVVADIQPNENAWGHVFVWDHDGFDYKDLVEAAKVVAAAVMGQFNLWRLSGLTPANNAKALAFLLAVGFKREGRIRDAVKIGGERCDAWVSGMTKGDLREALGLAPLEPDTIEEKPS